MKIRALVPLTRMRTSSLSAYLTSPSRGRVAVSALCTCAADWSLSIALPLLVLFAGSTCHADKSKKKKVVPPIIAVRVAEGHVVDDNGQPLDAAVVYLENPTSLDIKSYLSDSKGSYHFSQLASQTDYEVWAEKNGTQSKHKFISQFSSKTHFVFTLKVDFHPKKKKFLGVL